MTAPSVSVVVPTYERPAQLAACVRALSRLDHPRECLELVIVDDGSRAPPSADALREDAGGVSLRVVRARHGGPGAARNAGVDAAEGEIVAFTDDDCEPEPGWLSALVARLQGRPDVAAGGRTVNALETNPYSAASQHLVSYLYRYYEDERRAARRFFTTNNLALNRERFLALGGFDEDTPCGTAEDREFCARWLHAGNTLAYVPQALVRHGHALTLGSFLRQHHRYGRSALYVERRRARRSGGRFRLEPPSFYLRLVTAPFADERPLRAAGLALLLAASQAAYAHGVVTQITLDALGRGENGAR